MTGTRSQSAEFRKRRYEDGFRVLQGRREYVTYPENSSFRVWFSDTPWRYELHEHSAVEIVLTTEGTVEYDVGNTRYIVRKGEVLIIPPETPHSLSMGENSSRILFLFEPEPLLTIRDIKAIAEQFHRTFYLHDGSEAHIRIRETLLKASETYKAMDAMWNTMCYSYMLRMYTTLGQTYLIRSRGKQSGNHVESEVIAVAMGYINSHFGEELSLDDVAAFTGFSRYYFSRSFKRQTGYSFKDYLCQKRLQAAMDLLIQTNRSMRDVAVESGFGSVATFNRVFREKKGCTPTQYRAIYGTY